MREYISLKDVNGYLVFLRPTDLYMAMAQQDFKLLGLSIDVIIELLNQYQIKGGNMPVTTDSVIKVFGGLSEDDVKYMAASAKMVNHTTNGGVPNEIL